MLLSLLNYLMYNNIVSMIIDAQIVWRSFSTLARVFVWDRVLVKFVMFTTLLYCGHDGSKKM